MAPLIPTIVYYFLVALGLGTSCFAWIADPKLTGAGFIRLVMGVSGLALFFAVAIKFWFLGTVGIIPGLCFVLLILNFLLQWRLHPDGRTGLTWMAFSLQLVFGLILVWSMTSTPAQLTYFLSSVVFLGVTNYAMILGHYYLVVPKLSEKPLLVSLRIFWVLFILKVVTGALCTWWSRELLVEGSVLADGYLFNWLTILMRWLWGYAALIVLSWYAWKLCRMRSIQSATGVLYIMVFFVFIGELMALYLFLKHGLTL